MSLDVQCCEVRLQIGKRDKQQKVTGDEASQLRSKRSGLHRWRCFLICSDTTFGIRQTKEHQPRPMGLNERSRNDRKFARSNGLPSRKWRTTRQQSLLRCIHAIQNPPVIPATATIAFLIPTHCVAAIIVDHPNIPISSCLTTNFVVL